MRKLGRLTAISVALLAVGTLPATTRQPSSTSSAVEQGRHSTLQVSHSGVTYPTSRNWAGWATVGSRYRSVSATWRQPALHCSLLQTSYSSYWVGLDGAISPTVQQIGTDARCGMLLQASYSAWFELYPAPPIYFPNQVSPGDVFNASVTHRGSSVYTLVLRNVTRGWVQSRTVRVPGAMNKSAEVVAEAPSNGAGEVLPLANFGTVNFWAVKVNGVPIGQVPSPHKVTMTDGDLVKASVSRLSQDRAFSVTWEHR